MNASANAEISQNASSAGIARRSTRVDQIDVLRGLSILAVILLHINLRLRLGETPLGAKLPNWVVSRIVTNGYNGVIVFFAVSGFLITSTCLRRWGRLAGISLRQFYRLRFARIAPMLMALLVVLSALHLLHVPYFTINAQRSSLSRALFAALTFHVNWLEARHGYLPANWDILWSLSNEEVFYLALPVLCVAIRKKIGIVLTLLVFVVLGPFARVVFTRNEIWADKGYLSCMDAIAIGCLAAIAVNTVSLGRRTRVVIEVGGWSLIALVTFFRTEASYLRLFDTGLSVTVLALGAGLIAIASAQARREGTWLLAPIRWFGRNSYEVYLTHMMMIFAMLPLAKYFDPGNRWVILWYIIMIATAGVFGWCIAHFYSEPMNRRLRKRLQRTSHATVAG